MNYDTLLVNKCDFHVSIKFNRVKEKNSINTKVLRELNHAIDYALESSGIKAIVLEGEKDIFCSGMDFKEILEFARAPTEKDVREWANLFLFTLKRLTTIPKVVIAAVEGKALGGGVGLVAASDIVVAHEQALFSLPEALWGLIPAMITPYLSRRMGFQKTYAMALTSYSVNAKDAKDVNLVDEVSADVGESVRKRLKHINRLEIETIKHLKGYFKNIWELSGLVEERALEEITRLVREPKTIEKISLFVEKGVVPWEN